MNKLNMMKFGAAAMMSFAIASPALADNQNSILGAIPPGEASTAQFIHTDKSNGGAFEDTVLFSLSASGSNGNVVYTLQFSELAGKALKNISNATLDLVSDNASFQSLMGVSLQPNSGEVRTQINAAFVPGQYTATIRGNAVGANGGDYQFTVAAPTPEPAVVGSMAAGVALAGFVAMRRRRKLKTA